MFPVPSTKISYLEYYASDAYSMSQIHIACLRCTQYISDTYSMFQIPIVCLRCLQYASYTYSMFQIPNIVCRRYLQYVHIESDITVSSRQKPKVAIIILVNMQKYLITNCCQHLSNNIGLNSQLQHRSFNNTKFRSFDLKYRVSFSNSLTPCNLNKLSY